MSLYSVTVCSRISYLRGVEVLAVVGRGGVGDVEEDLLEAGEVLARESDAHVDLGRRGCGAGADPAGGHVLAGLVREEAGPGRLGGRERGEGEDEGEGGDHVGRGPEEDERQPLATIPPFICGLTKGALCVVRRLSRAAACVAKVLCSASMKANRRKPGDRAGMRVFLAQAAASRTQVVLLQQMLNGRSMPKASGLEQRGSATREPVPALMAI
jgi:hypothetical protein